MQDGDADAEGESDDDHPGQTKAVESHEEDGRDMVSDPSDGGDDKETTRVDEEEASTAEKDAVVDAVGASVMDSGHTMRTSDAIECDDGGEKKRAGEEESMQVENISDEAEQNYGGGGYTDTDDGDSARVSNRGTGADKEEDRSEDEEETDQVGDGAVNDADMDDKVPFPSPSDEPTPSDIPDVEMKQRAGDGNDSSDDQQTGEQSNNESDKPSDDKMAEDSSEKNESSSDQDTSLPPRRSMREKKPVTYFADEFFDPEHPQIKASRLIASRYYSTNIIVRKAPRLAPSSIPRRRKAGHRQPLSSHLPSTSLST